MIFTPEQRREINIMFDGCDLTPDGFQNPYFERLSREVRLCPCCGAKTALKPSLNPDFVYERCDRCGYRCMVEAPDPVKMGKKRRTAPRPLSGEKCSTSSGGFRRYRGPRVGSSREKGWVLG